MDTPLIDPTKLKLRTGQRLAVQTIVRRVRAGHETNSHTAIVLPTRYGKTDVMRIAGMMLMETHISRALILVPNTYLRAQVVDREKWDKSVTFYDLPSPPLGIPVGEAGKAPTPPFPRENLWFVSMTMQMAQQHVNLLTQWVDSEKDRLGVPPLVFVDEAHTGSTENQWGQTVNKLAEAGAFVCLLTATPFRTDKEAIPGFEVELVNTSDVLRRYRSEADPEAWDIFEGRRRISELKAHHVTTFREAWSSENNPPVLCDITRRPFDIEVDEIDPFTGELKRMGRLSKLSESQSRKVLDRELRKPRIIQQACEILVNRLVVRQSDEAETSAIVFVGNDKPGGESDNKHAQDVKRAIRSLAPRLRVEVATSSTPKADKTIERFVQKTDIDVLIVKQMAGLGVDSERLKVCLDLSNVRTLNAFIQRVTRIATVWDRRAITGRDTDLVSQADYITPDDVGGLRKYNYFIRDQGGGVTDEDLEYKGTIRGGPGVEWVPPDEVVAKDLVIPDEVQDSKLQTAPGSTLPVTDSIYEAFPELTKTRTQPDVAKAIPRLARAFRDAEPPAENGAGEPEPNGSQRTVRNVTDEKAALRKELDTLSREYTFQRVGRRYSRGDKEWEDVMRRFRANHREDVGIAWSNGKGLDEASLEQLTMMRDNMRRELDRLKERQS